MAKRFCAIFLLACLSFSGSANAGFFDGIIEKITVNVNKVTQGLQDLINGNTRLAHRMTMDYSPMDCEVRRWPDLKYIGLLAVSGNWVESEDICISMCWQYAQQGYPCKSVNYIQTKKTCEMMQTALTQDTSAVYTWTQDPTSNYIEPVSCKAFVQTTLAPMPTPGPNPKPTPGNGTYTNIRPGSCGQASVAQRVRTTGPGHRIVGGNEARQNSIPFIVSLRSDTWHYCGGTLVRVSNNKEESDIVITAAHCMSSDGSANFNVAAGAHYRDRTINGEQNVAAERVVIHPMYNKGQAYVNDIAIVKLTKPIKFSQTVQPACLPTSKSEGPADNANGIVAGWGALKEGEGGPDALMQVVVPIVGTETCKQSYSIDADAMMCAGYDQGQKDSCQGDSGGPFFFEGKQGYTLQGIVSWGSGCARPRLPGVYTRVTSYIDFIQTTIKSLTSIRV